jgi:phosphoribosylpyrophosphate synthetase
MKMTAVIMVMPMMPHSVQTYRRRESAIRSIVTQMLALIGTEHAE